MILNVYAQKLETSLGDPLNGSIANIGDIFGLVINLLIGIGWGLVFIMLALGFIQYIMSKGEKTAVDSAQKWLTYAVIGGVGLFFIGFLKTTIPTLIGATGGLNTGGGLEID